MPVISVFTACTADGYQMELTKKRTSLPRIVKISAEVQATEALRAQIIEGLLPPGSRITEVQLSEEMGISRATIRAALHELAKEGLLTLVPYTGWTVIELDGEDVWELYTLRAAVERLAAHLAAKRPQDEPHVQIRAAFERLARECARGSPSEMAEADFAFHKAIVDAASHRRLSAQYALIEQQIRVYIRSSDALVADPSEIIAQHTPMYEAILDGDADKAGCLAEQHNLTEGQKLGHFLGSKR